MPAASATNTRQVRVEPAPVWLRQKGETASAYATFALYREQPPPRSIKKVAGALGRGARVLEQWSTDHDWVERAAAYTDHLDSLCIAAREDELLRRRREENQRIHQIGRELQERGCKE